MPFGLASLTLIAASLLAGLAFFILVKVGSILLSKVLPADHPNQQLLADISQNSKALAVWFIKRIQWVFLFALFAAGVIITLVYS